MKLLISFLFLTLSCFGYQIGKNSSGIQLGYTSMQLGVNYGSGKTDSDFTGFSFRVHSNMNLTNGNSWGLDLHGSLDGSPSLSEQDVDISWYNFDVSLRPYFRAGIFSPYLVFGLSHTYYEIEDEGWGKALTMHPAIGLGVSMNFTESLVFSPSFLWTKVNTPTYSSTSGVVDFGAVGSYKFELPLVYQISDSFSLGPVFAFTGFDDIDAGAPLVFTSEMYTFMLKGDLLF